MTASGAPHLISMGTQIRVSGPGGCEVRPGKQTLQELISALAKERNEEACAKPSFRWGQVLGLILTIVVSAATWALVIAALLK